MDCLWYMRVMLQTSPCQWCRLSESSTTWRLLVSVVLSCRGPELAFVVHVGSGRSYLCFRTCNVKRRKSGSRYTKLQNTLFKAWETSLSRFISDSCFHTGRTVDTWNVTGTPTRMLKADRELVYENPSITTKSADDVRKCWTALILTSRAASDTNSSLTPSRDGSLQSVSKTNFQKTFQLSLWHVRNQRPSLKSPW